MTSELSGEKRKRVRAQLGWRFNRPGQADPCGPYWIVMNLSWHRDLRYRGPNVHFRHPTVEAATAEADRLSRQERHLGWRFGVFEFTNITCKVEPLAEQSVELTQAAE
jgi:hypothetical protein